MNVCVLFCDLGYLPLCVCVCASASLHVFFVCLSLYLGVCVRLPRLLCVASYVVILENEIRDECVG